MKTYGPITADGTTNLERATGMPQSISVTGTFSTATVTIQASLQDTSDHSTATRWATVATFSSADTAIKNILITKGELSIGALLRAVTTGGGSPSLTIDIL